MHHHITHRTRLLSLLMLLSLGMSSLSGRAQYYISEHILINEGLSNNYISDLVLDGKGRLWIATESGLNSYNGVSFTSYNVANSALSANTINCLWYDGQGNHVWAGTKGGGIARISPEQGQVVSISDADSLLSNVLCITPTTGRSLWLISPRDVMQLDLETERVQSVELGDVDRYFRCGVDDGNGNLILGSYMNGAYVLNGRMNKLTPLLTGQEEGHRVNVNDIQKDHSGRIWLATNVGLWYYQPGSTQLVSFVPIGTREVFHIEEIDDTLLWVVTNQGISVIDLSTDQVNPLQIGGELQLTSNIQCLYQDPHGNIWVGGGGSGLDFISHKAPYFTKLHNGSFWGIYEDGEVTWAGSRNHLYGFEGKQLTRHFDFSDQRIGALLAINGDGADLLYLAVPYHLLSLDKRTGQLREIKTDDGRDIEALTFYREDDGTLWITATDGVYTLRQGHVAEMTAINRVLNRQSANGIRRDRQGKLWVATYENGLYLFDSDYRLLCNLSRQSGFLSNSIQHLKYDSQGRLWMSTPDGPCCVPDTEYPGRYLSFGYAEGLRDTYVRAIQEDRNGNIWMSTNNGISMLRLDERTFVNYSQADYVPVNNLAGGAILQSDGGIVFTSMEGLCHCYPDSLTLSRRPIHIDLMSVEELDAGAQNTNRPIIMPDRKGEYRLGPEQNSFRLILGCPDYAQSRLLEFEYQVGGETGQWLPCDHGVITFRNLRPATYSINIRARLKGQPWHDQGIIRTTFVIEHPWWSSLWARIIYLLLLVLVGFVLIQHYLHRLQLTSQLELERRKNIDEQERNTERLQFFTNITHELKTPLTLIQAPLEEMLHDGTLSPTHARRIQLVYDSSLRLTDLCHKLIEFRRTETHNTHLKVRAGKLSQLTEEVGQSFVELNTNPNLQIVIETDPTEQPLLYDADVVRSILTNLLSNALKYTPRGMIRLSQQQVTTDGHTLTQVTVSDTGYGISAEALPHIFDRYYQARGPHQASGTGIGLAIVRSLVELHRAQIRVESQEGMGTTFVLTFSHDERYAEALHTDSIEQPTLAPMSPLSDDESKPLVLLVEDDAQIQHFMAESLSLDYRILQASHGREGLEMAFLHTPDIIITDLMMPVMDGITFCRTLKADIRTSHIPVVMLTAKDTREDQRQGYDSGADSYLTKPFSLQMLRSRLQNLLAARQRLADWLNAQSVAALTTPAAPTAERIDPVPSLASALSIVDQNFLNDVQQYVISHITSENIRMEDIAQSLRISHSTLYRKVKALTGLSGTEYIRKVRILHSAELLRSGRFNVSEAAYHCGFRSLPYFRSAFSEVFGMNPSEYLRQ